MWSLPVRQHVTVNGVSYERPSSQYQSENDSVILSTDANPSPGLSRVCVGLIFEKYGLSIVFRLPFDRLGMTWPSPREYLVLPLVLHPSFSGLQSFTSYLMPFVY